MKKTTTKKRNNSPSRLIDARIKELGDWRGETSLGADLSSSRPTPEVVEEWKWVRPTNPGTPVWSHAGIVCTGETYRNVVKTTFAKGASLEDPSGLCNAQPRRQHPARHRFP